MLDTTLTRTTEVPVGATLTHNGDAADVAPTVACTACGQDNLQDSRFCRHCGAALSAAVTAHGLATLPLDGAAPGHSMPGDATNDQVVDATPAVDIIPDGPSVSEEIDHRRAQQLVERAFALAERGDKAAAIVACRQAVSLDPLAVSGYSILGLLLEQAGDIPGAIHAYEKVMELAPDSLLEKESLERLRKTQAGSQAAAVFHFDEGELYEGSGSVDPVVAGAAASAATASVAATGAGASSAPGGAPAGRATVAPTARASMSVPAVRPIDFGLTEPRGPMWLEALKRQPSYYFRGAPLAATTVLSLVFLLWAHNWAVSQGVRRGQETVDVSSTTVPNGSGSQVVTPGVGGTAPNTAGTTGAAATGANLNSAGNAGAAVNSNGGAGLNGTSNGQPSAGQTVTNGSTAPTGNGAATTNGHGPGGGSNGKTAPSPRFPAVAPRPSGEQNATEDAQQLMGSLPPARPQPDTGSRNDAVSVIPSTAPDNAQNTNSRVISSGGAMVNPGGSGRGYVRVSPLRVSPSGAPTRSTTRANDAARAAAGAGRAGNTDRAVDLISPTMDAGDRAWNYQQRALLFLERGDFARARDDFGTAISAYHDQINRGENVAAAQKALRACEEGRQEAITRMSR